MVTENFGQLTWETIRRQSGIDVDYFISNEPYADEVTYKLAQTVSSVLHMTVDEVLVAFGEHWVLKTGRQKYGGLIEAGGHSLKEFLIHLPAFHNRVMLIYPNLTPPEFKITQVQENSLLVHYYSQREGLAMFVKGLLQGLGKLFQTPCTVDMVSGERLQNEKETYKVSW